jgi:hypothetical protein
MPGYIISKIYPFELHFHHRIQKALTYVEIQSLYLNMFILSNLFNCGLWIMDCGLKIEVKH